MKCDNISRAVLIALVVTAVVEGKRFSTPAQSRSLPTFEVDKSWPKMPAGNSLVQSRNQIVVYFNNDDLRDDAASAENVNFYTLIFTNGTACSASQSCRKLT